MTASVELPKEGKIIPGMGGMNKWPWWALAIGLAAAIIVYNFITNQSYNEAISYIGAGVLTTVRVTLTAYSMALLGGLFLGLGRVSKNVLYYNFATFYVELMRGIPMLVIILYGAFVVVPLGLTILTTLGNWLLMINFLTGLGQSLSQLDIQDIDMGGRAIAGLAMGYAAFEAEVFRAGIQSIEKGQMEAARSLGMNYFQSMRFVILPQALRRVLPPLGNDLIAILKDSSLISVLAVNDITQLGKKFRARSFSSFEAYNTMAFLYLCMTLSLSMVVKFIERKTSRGR